MGSGVISRKRIESMSDLLDRVIVEDSIMKCYDYNYYGVDIYQIYITKDRNHIRLLMGIFKQSLYLQTCKRSERFQLEWEQVIACTI